MKFLEKHGPRVKSGVTGKGKARKRRRWVKGVSMVLLGSVVMGVLLLAVPNPFAKPIAYGVTFSAPHAQGLGLDWQEVYLAALRELGVRHLRLSAYWNEIEPLDDSFDFADLDWQMDQAAKYNADVILSVGWKLPRWPECHTPEWAVNALEHEQRAEVLEMIEVVVERYKNHPALVMWQLENEPLLDFGVCPPEDRVFLAQEEVLLRSIDGGNQILITDSGELNSWLGAAKFGDIVGTTMYRTVFSKRTQKLFHYDYIFPAWAYRLKSRYVYLLYGKKVLVSELQGEPWGDKPFPEMTPAERLASFSPERFLELEHFARRTGLPQAYWWGVEYWYWEKEAHGNDQLWQVAKDIFLFSK